MISWDKLNEIIQTRMEVPLKVNLITLNYSENEEIEFYQKLLEECNFFKVNWNEETLDSATNKFKLYLSSKYPQLSELSTQKIGGYFSYNWR